MIINPFFEIVDVVGEYLAIPVGKNADSYEGIITLSETAAFLLKQLNRDRTKEELVELLTQEYEVEASKAITEIDKAISLFADLGIIAE